jgi:cobalt-zinc-cadmium efflux system membrane fusion protein
MKRKLLTTTILLVVIVGITFAAVALLKDHGEVSTNGTDDIPLTLVSEGAGELDWCAEHRVPESECTRCNPALIEQFKETGDWCPPHDLPESHCRLCNPEIEFPQEQILRTRSLELVKDEIEVTLYFRPNTTVCATNNALVQFASAQTAERSGITVQRVRRAEYQETTEAPAEIVFDETRALVVTSTVPALVARWLISPGDIVQQGDVLAILHSPEVVELQADLLSAHAAYHVQKKELTRHEELKSQNLISDSEYERQVAQTELAHAELTSARGLLLSTGINDSDIADLIETGTVSNEFAFRAPGEGLVVDRIAQLGELLEAGRAFALIADPSAMWIEARLTEEQIRNVSVGQLLSFTSDGHGLNRVGGKVIWVSRFLDPHTRTGIVRASVLDPTHELQAGEFGHVTIVEQHDEQVTLVPKDAVQWEGCCNVVFVREAVDRYRPRKVEISEGSGPYYQVTSGLEPGEEIVVDGAFLLKTELKKTSIGAGCCDVQPAG